MLAYKLKEEVKDYTGLNKGRIFAKLDNQIVLLANCTEPQSFYGVWTFNKLKEKDLFEEIELKEEKWIHPHLYKKVKEKMLQE